MFLFDNLFGERLGIFSAYEFGTRVFSTNGYYDDKHKWLFPNGKRQQGLLLLAFVRTIPTLVCAWVMREESGTCCISIRPSKTVGIYGDAL